MTEGLPIYLYGLLAQPLGLGVVAHGVVQARQVVQIDCVIGMLFTEGLPVYLHGLLVQLFGLGIVAHGLVQQAQAVQTRGVLGMVFTQKLPPYLHGPLVQRLRLAVVAHGPVQAAEVVQVRGVTGVLFTQRRPRYFHGSLVQRLRLGVLAHGVVQAGHVVEIRGILRILRAEGCLGEPDQLFGDRDSFRVPACLVKGEQRLIQRSTSGSVGLGVGPCRVRGQHRLGKQHAQNGGCQCVPHAGGASLNGVNLDRRVGTTAR